ncbi:MAG: Asp-tRNA(Asn)/Glu-tRNA(Gln) amidotransferase subunit GatC [Myxococcota bacterium]|nr:Asp-tRNA(Asn)/Glu-tRNA(Gln) amidotransferase subunit GatC [Myxococcota bacterium]
MSDETISLNQVKHIAKLARLSFPEEDLVSMQVDLQAILGYINKLEELDTCSIDATIHPHNIPLPLREDHATPALPREDVLKQAPEVLANGFGVPKVIE